jgi:hypothetical protein
MGRGWVCFGLLLVVGACGGRSERQGSDDGAASAATNGDDDQPGGGDDQGGGDDDAPGDQVTLPSCTRGPVDSGQMGEECLWLADGRCYSDKLDACACICPVSRESICSSGFPSDAGRTPVYCR